MASNISRAGPGRTSGCARLEILSTRNKNINGKRNVRTNLAAAALWRMPGRFEMARVLGPSYSLRCVVFHDVAAESPFTRGMHVTVTPDEFEAALKFLTRYYTPVRLQDVLDASNGRGLPPRPVLVTFDDGYASIMECAAPLCAQYGVPAVLFLNAAFLDNEELAPDNLVCFVANVLGMEAINTAVRSVRGAGTPQVRSLGEVFSPFFESISLAERRIFLDTLAHLAGIKVNQAAREAGLYLTRRQVRDLASDGFEIGNHTYNHVHCRSLTRADFDKEIKRNRAELEALSGRKITSFSVPYGSSADLTYDLVANLQHSGYEAVFTSESVANQPRSGCFRFDRISVHASNDGSLFSEIEVLPRLRAVRNWASRGFGFVSRSGTNPFQSHVGGPHGEDGLTDLQRE